MALFYPFTVATMAAGMLAFVMIVFNIDLLLIGMVVLWFYFVSIVSIYFISEEALKKFSVHKLFLTLMITIGILAVLSSILTLHGFSAAI